MRKPLAAREAGAFGLTEPGQRMMRTAAPEAFANVAAADRIVTGNRETLEACRKRADKSRSTASCTIRIEPRQK